MPSLATATCQDGLTSEEHLVLVSLSNRKTRKKATATEVATALGQDVTSVCNLLEGLENAGRVEKDWETNLLQVLAPCTCPRESFSPSSTERGTESSISPARARSRKLGQRSGGDVRSEKPEAYTPHPDKSSLSGGGTTKGWGSEKTQEARRRRMATRTRLETTPAEDWTLQDMLSYFNQQVFTKLQCNGFRRPGVSAQSERGGLGASVKRWHDNLITLPEIKRMIDAYVMFPEKFCRPGRPHWLSFVQAQEKLFDLITRNDAGSDHRHDPGYWTQRSEASLRKRKEEWASYA